MKEQKLILVDQDNVIADLEGALIEAWKVLYPDLPFIEQGKRVTFAMKDQYPGEQRKLVERIFRFRGLFRNLAPIEGALNALQDMDREGYAVMICTSPLTRYENCVQEKYEWVAEHLGRDWARRIILTKDKTVVRGDILIDDKPHITGLFKPSWEHIIFDQPYNRHVTSLRRLTNWSEWRSLLEPA